MGKANSEERDRLLKERVRIGLLRSYRNLEIFLADEKASKARERGIIAELLKWRDAYIEAAQVAVSLADGEMAHLLEMAAHTSRVSLNTLAITYLTMGIDYDDLDCWAEIEFIKSKEDEIKRALDALDKEGNSGKSVNNLIRIVGRYTTEYINEFLTTDIYNKFLTDPYKGNDK